jgi:hypothetical protein
LALIIHACRELSGIVCARRIGGSGSGGVVSPISCDAPIGTGLAKSIEGRGSDAAFHFFEIQPYALCTTVAISWSRTILQQFRERAGEIKELVNKSANHG